MTKFQNVIGGLDLDQKIFRITDLEYVLNSITDNTSYFAWPPGRWRDPYDSVFMKVPCKIGKDEPFSHGYLTDYFCQCWCKRDSESDAMWRLYSDAKKMDGVMIFSTVRKVFESIFDDSNKFASLYTFCGPVTYKPITAFHDPFFFQQNLGVPTDIWNSTGRGIAASIMFKIDAYDHENEVRFVVGEPSKAGQDHIFVKHQPSFLGIADALTFDPRASKSFVEMATRELEKRGAKMKIAQSDLYTLKPKQYQFDGCTE